MNMQCRQCKRQLNDVTDYAKSGYSRKTAGISRRNICKKCASLNSQFYKNKDDERINGIYRLIVDKVYNGDWLAAQLPISVKKHLSPTPIPDSVTVTKRPHKLTIDNFFDEEPIQNVEDDVNYPAKYEGIDTDIHLLIKNIYSATTEGEVYDAFERLLVTKGVKDMIDKKTGTLKASAFIDNNIEKHILDDLNDAIISLEEAEFNNGMTTIFGRDTVLRDVPTALIEQLFILYEAYRKGN